MKHLLPALAGMVVFSLTSRGLAQPCEPAWDPAIDGSGVSGTVRSLLSDGDDLIVGGSFTQINETTMDFIARLSDGAWSGYDGGFDGPVFTLGKFDGALHAAGNFEFSGGEAMKYIARWTGESWAPLGSGLGSAGHAMLPFDSGDGLKLYVGGTFQTAGGAAAPGVARWDGEAWSAIPGGLQGGQKAALSLCAHDSGAGDVLYIGGSFLGAGGQLSPNVVRWSAAGWSACGDGLNGLVRTMVVFNGNVIAGGEFTMSGEVGARRLARWDGAQWSEFAGGANGVIHTLRVIDTPMGERLIAGGLFSEIGGVAARSIAIFDGETWSPLDMGLSSTVRTVVHVDDDLYVGADASTPGGSPTPPLRKWSLCVSGVTGDLNGDGLVNGVDLAILLSQWGPAGGADLTGDDIVNGADLATLLSNWG